MRRRKSLLRRKTAFHSVELHQATVAQEGLNAVAHWACDHIGQPSAHSEESYIQQDSAMGNDTLFRIVVFVLGMIPVALVTWVVSISPP